MLNRGLSYLLVFFIFSVAAQGQNKAVVYYKAGMGFMEKKMFTEALNAFTTAIRVNKKFDSAYVQLGNIYLLQRKDSLAFLNYKKALAINPHFTDALFSQGKIYRYYKNKPDLALSYFKAAAGTDNTNKEIFYNIAWCFNTKMQYDSAIVYGIKSLGIDNNFRPAYGELGFAYRMSKRFADGLAQFKKNLAISIVDIAILYSGYCYVELKDKTAALQQYDALIKINTKMAATLKKAIDKME